MSAPARGEELRDIYAASVAAIEPVAWNGERVITTELIAQLYRSGESAIRKNFSRNTDRFEEGKHYFKLNVRDLRDMRVTYGHTVISPRATSLVPRTARSAARHAKMLETDAAWDVFEAMEDSYFASRQNPVDGPADDLKLSTFADREPLLLAAVRMVVRHRQPFDKVYRTMNCYAGSARF